MQAWSFVRRMSHCTIKLNYIILCSSNKYVSNKISFHICIGFNSFIDAIKNSIGLIQVIFIISIKGDPERIIVPLRRAI